MNIFSLFNIEVGSSKDAGNQAAPSRTGARPSADSNDSGSGEKDKPGTIGAFITPQSLVSFTGATGAISIIWSTITTFAVPDAATGKLIGLGLSFLVGFFIYLINISDPKTVLSPREKGIAFGIAVLNSFVLFVASFGTQAALDTAH